MYEWGFVYISLVTNYIFLIDDGSVLSTHHRPLFGLNMLNNIIMAQQKHVITKHIRNREYKIFNVFFYLLPDKWSELHLATKTCLQLYLLNSDKKWLALRPTL